jgi:hypothetical protein
MKIRHTVLGRLLAHGLALLAQPSGRGTRAGPHQWRYGADPRRGRRAQRVLVGGLAVTDLRRGPAGGHGEGPGKAPGMVRWWGAQRGDGTAVRQIRLVGGGVSQSAASSGGRQRPLGGPATREVHIGVRGGRQRR